MQTSMQELFVLWPICERCGHALSLHGQLNIEPREERLRRVKVAVRMDELLEVCVNNINQLLGPR